MIQDKINEAKFFLKKMNEKPELFDISCYYSGFLSASYSVYDYALHNANRVFQLGLPDEGYWNWNTFQSEAEKQKNIGAQKYVKWWKSRQEIDNNMILGKAFSTCRRINTHKRPTYKIGINANVETNENVSKSDDAIRIPIKIITKFFLQVEGFEQMPVEDSCGKDTLDVTK